MYFPILKDIQAKYNITSDDIIRKFDVWLGVRRPAVWKYLNPNQFSLDTDINNKMAFDLFDISTDPEFQLLEARYVVEIDTSSDLIKTYKNLEDIPKSIEIEETEVEITDQMVRIYFSLLKPPSSPPELTDLENSRSGVAHSNIPLPTKREYKRKNIFKRIR